MNVLTMGSFDMLHPGHVGLFAKCRQLAGTTGTVIVAVNTDHFITRYKRHPLFTYEERAAVIGALHTVDAVIPNDGTNQSAIVHDAGPDLLVIGYDWHTKDYLKQIDTTLDQLTAWNVNLVYVPRTGDWSTTQLRRRLTDGVD